jgi:polyphosphate kinase 2
MKAKNLTKADLALLNSKMGLYVLLKKKELDLEQVLEEVRFLDQMEERYEELIKLQNWVIQNEQKVVVIFEGRDVAGKGGAIRRITQFINPRHFRTVALNIPTEDERAQWFFQRYINALPNRGEMVFFDRSWYNRAVVEPVNNFCTEKEYRIFMSQVNDFERMLVQSNTYLIKLYFSISKEEQARRFQAIKSDPLKRWKMTPVDEKAQALWDEYTRYEEKMFEQTDTETAPWVRIDANNKFNARLQAISHILEVIPYN